MVRGLSVGLVAFFALAGLSGPSAADDSADCYGGAPSERSISACTRLVDAGKGSDPGLTIIADALTKAYTRRGYLYARRAEGDDFDRAIADCNEAIRLQPRNPLAIAVRAAAYIHKDDLTRALADLNEGLRVAPHDSAIHNVLGSYYTAKGDYDHAIRELNEALRINPKNAFAYRHRGIAYEKKGDLNSALADFRVALSADPARREGFSREAGEGIQRVEKRLADLKAQPKPQPTPTVTSTEPAGRNALVIGNERYPDADPPLNQPVKHARSFAEELRKSGYDVDVAENLTRQGLRQAVDKFTAKIKPGVIALLFFSGYGIQANKQTYLIPVDAQVWSEKDVTRDGINLEALLAEMNGKGASSKVVIVDACRRNPYERRFRRTSGGLAPVTMPAESLVIYSAAAGQVAEDDSELFVGELAKELRAGSGSAEGAFIRTRMNVSNRTKGKQIPWLSSSLTSRLKFSKSSQ